MRKNKSFMTFKECKKILLTPRAWRIVLVCSHSILVSVIVTVTVIIQLLLLGEGGSPLLFSNNQKVS